MNIKITNAVCPIRLKGRRVGEHNKICETLSTTRIPVAIITPQSNQVNAGRLKFVNSTSDYIWTSIKPSNEGSSTNQNGH